MKITAEELDDGRYRIVKIEGLSLPEIITNYGAGAWHTYTKGTHCSVYYSKGSYGDTINFIVSDEWNKTLSKPYGRNDNEVHIGSRLSIEDYLRLLTTLEECSRRLRTLAGLKTRKAIGKAKLLITTTF